MEQTLGKRISENRKRLKLTQDQLAEKLGVTAQAVSKWENDQSCPDITTLPKLAEIFGISTDALLGAQTAPVREAEVVTEPDDEKSSSHWEFTWDGGRKHGLCFAAFILLIGVLTLLSNLLSWNVGFWDILWPAGVLMLGIHILLSRFSMMGMGFALFGGYSLLSNLQLLPWKLGSNIILPAILILFGLSLLADALRKPRKPKFKVLQNGNDKKTESSFSEDDDSFSYSLSFGECRRQVNLPTLSEGDITCSFGELEVDLSGCGAVNSDCDIEITCSFGEVKLLVPRRFRVETDPQTAFASIEVSGNPDPNPAGVITLDVTVSFGAVTVEYI